LLALLPQTCEEVSQVGLIEAIFFPSDDLTHVLLMNKPMGWVYLRPLGAVSCTDKYDMYIMDV
jgi:hypothetical protein